jgi:hypothetical protein
MLYVLLVKHSHFGGLACNIGVAVEARRGTVSDAFIGEEISLFPLSLIKLVGYALLTHPSRAVAP